MLDGNGNKVLEPINTFYRRVKAKERRSLNEGKAEILKGTSQSVHQKSYDEFQEDMRGVKERIRREREDIDRVKLEKLEQSKRNLNLQM